MTDSNPSYREHIYRSADDRLDLYARVYDGDGPPLLLMHGLTRNSSDFEPLAAYLAPDYQLIIPDQRGRGKSEYDPEPQNYLPQIYAGDMFALLEGLGVETATLIGTSMGGLIAMLMALGKPDAVRGIVLNDIGPAVDPAGIERIKSYVGSVKPPSNWQEAAAYIKQINGSAFPDVTDDAVWMDFARRSFVEKDGRLHAAYDPAIAGGMEGSNPDAVPPDLWPLWDMLAAIPLLAIRGAISDILPASTLKEMARRHPENFTAVEIPQRGHAPMLDEPGALAAITRFLTELHKP